MHHLMDARYDQFFGQFFELLKELSVSSFEKTSESKNWQFQFIILIEPMVFCERTGKELMALWAVLCLFINDENRGYMPNLVT